MVDASGNGLTDAELADLFDRLFPHGFAGSDVIAEIAPEGWEQSPLLACFHPSVEVAYRETLMLHRNLDRLRRSFNPAGASAPSPEPTLETVRATWKNEPIDVSAEVTELVGMCLWDVFSDNNEVTTADGRIADTGSFRGSSAFLDEYADRRKPQPRAGDYMRFYMGTFWIGQRADLTRVYQMIFRRLRAAGADWRFRFTETQLVDLTGGNQDVDASPEDAVNLERLRGSVAAANAIARQETLGHPPDVIRAYERVYGRVPRGWPPR